VAGFSSGAGVSGAGAGAGAGDSVALPRILAGFPVKDVNDSADLESASPIPPIDVAYAKTAVVIPTKPYAMTGTPNTCKVVTSDIIKLYN